MHIVFFFTVYLFAIIHIDSQVVVLIVDSGSFKVLSLDFRLNWFRWWSYFLIIFIDVIVRSLIFRVIAIISNLKHVWVLLSRESII